MGIENKKLARAFTPQMEAELRELYRGDYMRNGAVGRFAARWRLPRWKVSHRAQQLGLARTKEKPWSEAELQLLERIAHLHPMTIARRMRARGFDRTATAVVLKRKRMRIRRDGYTSYELAEAMGVTPREVRKWIEAGLLRAQRVDNPRRGDEIGWHWYLRPCHVREFLMNYVAEWDHRRVDKYWLVDLLTNLAAGCESHDRRAMKNRGGILDEE